MAPPERGQHRGGVELEVTGGQRRPALRCRACDRRGHLPVVERGGALAADPFEQRGKSRLLNPRSRCSGVSEELPVRGPAIESAAMLVEGRSQWFSERKPLGGQPPRWTERGLEWQAPVPSVRRLPGRDRTGHRYRSGAVIRNRRPERPPGRPPAVEG